MQIRWEEILLFLVAVSFLIMLLRKNANKGWVDLDDFKGDELE